MPAGLNMSLDEMMNNSNSHHRRNNHLSHGPTRHHAVRNPVRTTPYSISQLEVMEVSDDDHGAVVHPKPKPVTKLYLSNLDERVSNEDIHLLFSEEGELEGYSLHYDQFGRSKGTAEVVFIRQSDALAALKRYNNMKLDGKTLQIELVGTSLVTPAATALGQSSLLGKPNDAFARCKIPIHDLMSSGKSSVAPVDTPLGQSSLLGKPNVFARCVVPIPSLMSSGTSLVTTADTPLGQSLLGRTNGVFVRKERKIGGSRYNNSFTHGHLPTKKDHTRKASFGETDHDFERYHLRAEAKRHISKLSAKDLDDDLEKYRSEAKKINK